MAHVAKSVPPTPVSTEAPAVRVTGAASFAPVIPLRGNRTLCQTCGMREFCLTAGLSGDEVKAFDALIAHRTRLRKNDTLYRAGDPFFALYAIQFGSLKTALLGEDGREQMTGYHMLGEIIGLDGIGTDRHRGGAIALEDTEVCVLPFAGIEHLARTVPALQHNVHRMMSREITRDQSVMLALGSMRAEERLAIFLLDLADRYRRRSYSSTEYVLRMTREEIGSYLGLKLETVSRLFSRFHEEGVIQVQGRAVKLLDPARLKLIVGRRG